MNRPVPTSLRVLRGNPGKRPLPNEPKREALTVEGLVDSCPEHFNGEKRKWWEYYAAQFAPSKIITATDLVLLEQLCSATAERVDFDRKLEAPCLLYTSPSP